MGKKKILALIILVVSSFIFAACGERVSDASDPAGTPELAVVETESPVPVPELGEEESPDGEGAAEESARSYTRLTQAEWETAGPYSLFLTSVQEQGDRLLLRGVFVRDWLAPEEVAEARDGREIEINGEAFVFAENFEDSMVVGDLRNVRTGSMDIALVPMPFAEGGRDIRYILTTESGYAIAWKLTELYREVEIGKDTIVSVRPAEPEWPFEPMEIRAGEAFSGFTAHGIVDGVLAAGVFSFSFVDGEVLYVFGSERDFQR